MADKQSRIDSVMEAVCNVAVGLGISFVANMIFIPLATGAPLSTGANVMLGVIYTIISLVRSYCIRRLFNGRGIWESIRCR